MTDITPPDWVLREAAERSELSNDAPRQRAILFDTNPSFRALCRAIEQHEATKLENEQLRHDLERHMLIADEQHETLAAEKEQLRHDLERQMTIANEHVNELETFKQKVSDALVEYFGEHLVAEDGGDALASFVIPKPKPDPLEDVLADTFGASLVNVEDFRAALEARGLEIREKGQ